MKFLQSFRIITSALLLSISFSSYAAYEVVWQDDFDDEKLNSTVWSHEVGGHGFGNQEQQYYTRSSDNLYIYDGKLHIRALRETVGQNIFTSARIKSARKVTARYGRMEALIKCPEGGKGVWPAFWMMGADYDEVGWPRCGEIDILEMQGSRSKRSVFALHWNHEGGPGEHSGQADYSGSASFSNNLGDEFRIYGLEWTPDEIIGYITDPNGGNRKQSLAMGITDATISEFHQEHYFIMNLAMGGMFDGNVTDPNIKERIMEVEWVRILQDEEAYPASSITNKSNLYGGSGADPGEIQHQDKDYWVIYKDDVSAFDGDKVLDCSSDFFIDGDAYGDGDKCLIPVAGAPYEGANSLAFTTNPEQGWYGGFFEANEYDLRTLQVYDLHLRIKSDLNSLKFVIKESSSDEASYVLTNASGDGYTASGGWQEVVIPLSKFSNMDFSENRASSFLFGFYQGNAAEAGKTVELDDIYFQRNPEYEAQLENPPVLVAATESQTKQPGEFLRLSVHVTGAGLSYQWSKDGVELPLGKYASYVMPDLKESDAGTYVCTITNQYGEISTENIVISISEETAVKDVKKEPEMFIYPNPASDYVSIQLEEKAVLTVFDLSGRLIYTEALEAGLNTVDISVYHNGLYVFSLSGNTFVKTQLLEKQ